jgi:hypothetical protein
MEGEEKGKTLVFCEKRMKNKHTRKRVKIERGTWKGE